MRILITALVLVAAIAPPPALANAELMAEVLALFEAEALVPPPDAARTAKNEDDLVRALHSVDPYLEIKLPLQPSTATTNSRGLGLVVSTLGEGVLVMPVEGGPAFAAGLKDPAYLLTVNNQPVDGIAADAIRTLVSNGGMPVELRMATAAAARPLILRLESAPVARLSVEKVMSGPVTVLRVHEFIAGETQRLLLDSLDGVDKTTKAVVLDLRLNPGGSLYEAFDAASLFLRPGLPIGGTRDHKGNTLMLRAVETTSFKPEPPLAVLVSDHTASAAKSFTRALQWHNRALVVGRTTFGKCLSQRMFPLTSGGSVLISNLVILGPDGQDCGKAGVIPDLPVSGAAILETGALIEYTLARNGCPYYGCGATGVMDEQ